MQKKNAPLKRILSNLKQLVPYIGALFVVSGIIGLLLIQNPLQTSQDTRSDASEGEYAEVFPNITGELKTPFVVNETGEILLKLDTAGHSVKKVKLIFSIVNQDIDTPIVAVNAGAGFRSEILNIQETDDGYLVHIEAVPSKVGWFVPPKNQTFVRVAVLSPNTGEISLHFDQDNSYISTPAIESLLVVPDALTYTISRPTSDDDTDNEVVGCNEVCSNNADCAVGMRCFTDGNSQRCRLATNTSSQSCATAEDTDEEEVVIRQCNEYCDNNRDCSAGLTCYENYCRNPRNPQDNRCANPTAQQEADIIQSCGETCSTNADCAVNLRCYESECRLATNPSSTSCSAVTQKTVSPVYEKKATETSEEEEIAESDTPLKGANMIPNTDKTDEYVAPSPTVKPDRKDYDSSYEADETLFDLIRNMAKDNSSKLPFFIILLGIILLVGSILLSLLAAVTKKRRRNTGQDKLKNGGKIHVDAHPVKPGSQPGVQPFTQPTTAPGSTVGSTKNPVTQNLLKKLEEEQKNK